MLAQQLLRHSSSTSADIYVHPDASELAGVADVLGKVLLGDSGDSCGTPVVHTSLATETIQ